MEILLLIIMMGMVETSGIIRAPRAAYKKQTNVSEMCDYFTGVTAAMLLNALYSGITTKITAAQAKITACRAAIQAVIAGSGTVKQRNQAEYLMQNEMNTLLVEIQIVGNNDIPNAVINYENIDVIYRTRKSHERDELKCIMVIFQARSICKSELPKAIFRLFFSLPLHPLMIKAGL